MRRKKSLLAIFSAVMTVAIGFLTPVHAATTVKMVLWPGPEGDAMQKVVNAYNSGQGMKDQVNVKMILLSRDNTFGKEATLMKSHSNEYDIYFTASYLVGQHAPYMTPITGINDKLYLKAAVNSLKVGGAQMALPLDTSLHFLYYRKDLLANIDAAKYASIAQQVLGKSMQPNSNPNTWSWDDVLAASAYFTQQYNSDSPTKYGFAMQGKNLLYNTMIWNDVLWSFGGNWLKNGKPNLNTTEAKKAMNVYYTMYTKGLTSPDSSNAEYPETNAALESGNAAFALQWNAAYTELNTTGSTKGVLGIAPPPGTGPRTHVHALAIGLNKYSKNQAAAIKWMHYLATVPAMQIYANNGGVPSMPSILKGMISKNPTFANVISYGNGIGYSESAGPHEFDIYAAIAQALSPMWAGTKTPDQVAPDADTAIANVING